MFDTSPLTTRPTAQQRAWIEAREREGAYGPPVQLTFAEKATWFLLDVVGRFTWHQMAAFAEVNGLNFRRKTTEIAYPGMMFTQPGLRFLANHVSAPDGSFDIGRYVCVGGDGVESYYWTYAAFRLPNVMPQLVLDNRLNDKVDKLPIDFRKGQEYDLGGVFAKQWRLYAPGGYGQDVYQIIATDVMEILARHPYCFDVEIVDDWLFLYSPTAYLFEVEFWTEVDELRRGVAEKLATRIYLDRHDELAASGPSTAPSTLTSPDPLPDRQAGRRIVAREKKKHNGLWTAIGAFLVIAPWAALILVMLKVNGWLG